MKSAYIKEIKQAFKSAEFWFIFLLIIVTSAWNALYHSDKYGVLSNVEIGAAEFFYACIMLGNTLLQISVPIIPIFVTMHSSGLHEITGKSFINKEEHPMMSRILSTITISSIVFILSFLAVALIGIIFFPASTGGIIEIGGPFSAAYYAYPFSIIPLTIIYSCVFASVYSLLGMGIGMNLKKNRLLALFIPTIYYFCFYYIAKLLPVSLQSIVYWIVPIETFNLVGTIPLYKKLIELAIVLVVAVFLIIIANKKKAIRNLRTNS